eukprot:TRINITY_DN6855_c0_g1_i1.p1 TRINITY_DN6855_c0_g1~~TRINITY_DN6855_c0_g1_i1.p1  ORF type:complete len:1019 (+),score=341.54 TRINITY_DN6855_c0_g1_i1:37-3093(+)
MRRHMTLQLYWQHASGKLRVALGVALLIIGLLWVMAPVPPTFIARHVGVQLADTTLTAGNLRVNYLDSPFIDTDAYLSWELTAPPEAQNKRQTAYRIVARGLAYPLPVVLWDSGRVESDTTIGVPYGGKVLSKTQVVWNVTVWDEGNASTTSASATFTFALLSEADWGGAEWVAREIPPPVSSECDYYAPDPTPIFKLAFPLDGTVAASQLYIAALGYYQVRLNGILLSTSRTQQSYLDPPQTSFDKRVLYNGYDVARLLKASSENTLEVELGNGWYNPLPLRFWGRVNLRDSLAIGSPMLKVLLEVRYTEGSVQAEATAGGATSPWAVFNSSTLFNNIYLGEAWDDTYAGTTVSRKPVTVTPTLGPLQASTIPPIIRRHTLPATVVSVQSPETRLTPTKEMKRSRLRHGVALQRETLEKRYVFDSGKNHAGTCQFTIYWSANAPVGSLLHGHAKYGELMWQNGSVNVMTSVAGQIKRANKDAPCQPDVAYQRDDFLLQKSTATSIWEPKFSWHGMRYIELEIYSNGSTLMSDNVTVTCYAMRTSIDEALTDLAISDAKLQKTLDMSLNTFDSNLMSVQSDCPHRERFGYGGDPLASGESFIARYDVAAFYSKRVTDFVDAQRSNGGYTETAPYVGISDGSLGGDAGSIGWAAYPPETLKWLYKYYGNTATLKQAYSSMLRFAALLESNPDTIKDGLGDWMPLEATGVDFTGLGFQYTTYLAVANVSCILKDSGNCEKFQTLAETVKDSINAQFLDTATGSYGNIKSPFQKKTTAEVYNHLEGGRHTGVSFNGSQTGQGMALYNGLAPPDVWDKSVKVLTENLEAASYVPGADSGPKQGGPGPHMLSGMFGVKWVLGALSESGNSDLAYNVVTQETYPSLYWMTSNEYANATTAWESWYFSNNTFSHNHPMMCSHDTWFLHHVLGVMPHPAAAGFDRAIIRPRPPLLMAQRDPSGVASVKGTYKTVRGPITLSWHLVASTKKLSVSFSIPPNMRADVIIPNLAPIAVGSGTYSLATTL